MPARIPTTWLVLPCYNEAARLDAPALEAALGRWSWLHLCLVDDGSHDDTLARLQAVAEAAPPGRVRVLALPRNAGKGEAVRAGLLQVLAHERPVLVGYWDADLSAPLDAVPLLARALLDDPRRELALASRVKILGTTIERRAVRHYGGRVIATLISLALDLPVYDTQCGAKLMRAGPDLAALLDAPFQSRWLFDVELIARWLQAHPPGAWRDGLCEVPLPRWTHSAGSKLSLADALGAPVEVLRIRRRYGPTGR